jgi:hypothetical protein
MLTVDRRIKGRTTSTEVTASGLLLWIIVYPLRDGNRRPVHVITHNFLRSSPRDAE